MDSSVDTTREFRVYPPRIADTVDVTERTDNGKTRFVLRNSSTSRYFQLGFAEFKVVQQINGQNSFDQITAGGADGEAPRVTRQALVRFLTKIDSFGMLQGSGVPEAASQNSHYLRFKFFNPDRFLGWLDSKLGWLFDSFLFRCFLVLVALAAFGLINRREEVTAYADYCISNYSILSVLAIALLITFLHEIAHGLACKHYGGEVRELGVLLIYYVMPAMYCNVSDIHRMGSKKQRVLVIFAGIYFQLLISGAAALVWLVATPYTFLADAGFVVLMAGTFNLLINCNPLIKLDGYYALSQLIGIMNLQQRSSQYISSLVGNGLRSAVGEERISLSKRAFFIGYWTLSFLYSIGLVYLILEWLGFHLMNSLGFLGVVLTLGLAALLTERWWRPSALRLIKALDSMLGALNNGVRSMQTASQNSRNREGALVMSAQTVTARNDNSPAPTATSASKPDQSSETSRKRLDRRRVAKWGLFILVLATLLAPWDASTASDCTLLLPPGREGIARANTDAVLSQILVRPGDRIHEGALLARFASPDLEDRLARLDAEAKALEANNARVEEEIRARAELLMSAGLKESERKRILDELKAESALIGSWDGVRERERSEDLETGNQKQQTTQREDAKDTAAIIRVSNGTSRPRYTGSSRLALSSASSDRNKEFTPLPPALAILEADIKVKQNELSHNRLEVERYARLLNQGLVGAQLYDRAVAAMHKSEGELQGTRARFEAALVDHRRLTSGAETSSLIAETEVRSARSGFDALLADLRANRQQLEIVRQRRDLLQKEYDGMSVIAPLAGVVLGEDLGKMLGRRYSKGEEIVRIGELEGLLLQIDVSEREIADVKLDSSVRFKLKTVPGRTFSGQVSKIDPEAKTNQYGQRFYAVDVRVENTDGLLRPGMSGFARVSVGRQPIGVILASRIWQALRPETFLF